MIQLYGISNAGFSFTHTYLLDIINLKKYVEKNKQRHDLTYADLQGQIENPSRVRMIVPFLRKIGIVNDSGFEEKNQILDFNNFFTKKAKPFLKFLDVYSDSDIDYDDSEIMTKLEDILKEILSLYLSELCGEKEYKIVLSYLLKYNTLDKYEFFFITSFLFNNVTDIMGYSDVDSLIIYYRDNPNIKSNFTFASNVNCYSYMMQILCNFNVSKKVDTHFEIINKELVKKVIGV